MYPLPKANAPQPEEGKHLRQRIFKAKNACLRYRAGPRSLDTIPDYRFVVMARLVSPDDARKETVAVTINDAPLPPDAMPAIYRHHTDVIQYDGTLYDNLARFHSDKIPEIDPASLIPVGEVERSGVMRDLKDFDATKLPEGTPLYRLEGYANLLVAKHGEETLVYGYGMK